MTARRHISTLTNMSTAADHAVSPAEALQHARAERLRDLFEPWSLRRLEARTGLGRGTLQGRFNGTTALTISDIEVLAPVIRMTPAELFAELLTAGTKNGPESGVSGPSLPGLDSNQEPIGSQQDDDEIAPTNVTHAQFGRPARDVAPRPIAQIGGAR